MIIPAMILVFVLCLFFLVWNVTRGHRDDPDNVLFLNTNENEIDVTVLGLLLSRGESAYLRRYLSDREFRTVRRSRVSLARKYLAAVNRNARQIVHAAEAAQSSSDLEVARAARDLLSIAFRIRLNVPVVHFCLLGEWLWPTLSLIAPARINAYEEVAGRLVFILRRLPRVREMSPAG